LLECTPLGYHTQPQVLSSFLSYSQVFVRGILANKLCPYHYFSNNLLAPDDCSLSPYVIASSHHPFDALFILAPYLSSIFFLVVLYLNLGLQTC
jgi:hypothetical protein